MAQAFIFRAFGAENLSLKQHRSGWVADYKHENRIAAEQAICESLALKSIPQ
jgi:hypothetical protein